MLPNSFWSGSIFRRSAGSCGRPRKPTERRLRERYKAVVQAHIQELDRRFRGDRVDYTLLDTSKPLDHALFRYLVLREKRSRVR